MIGRIRTRSARLVFVTVMTAGVVLGITSMIEPPGPQKLYDVKPGARTVEQVYRNIQVLRGMPVLELYSTMESYNTALGVSCGYCHEINAYDKDTKSSKQAARRMIRLQMAINRDQFDGHVRITCYSCHRGAVKVPQG